jgi:hypothetical protein
VPASCYFAGKVGSSRKNKYISGGGDVGQYLGIYVTGMCNTAEIIQYFLGGFCFAGTTLTTNQHGLILSVLLELLIGHSTRYEHVGLRIHQIRTTLDIGRAIDGQVLERINRNQDGADIRVDGFVDKSLPNMMQNGTLTQLIQINKVFNVAICSRHNM